MENTTPQESKDTIGIFYGSQTGSTATLAKMLSKRFSTLRLKHQLKDLFETKPSDFKEAGLIIILISTYYEGQAPDSTAPFYNWLKLTRNKAIGKKNTDQKNTPMKQTNITNDFEFDDSHLGIFENKFFSVFGLGDINYTNFNSIGLKVDKYLGELGGRRILDVGMGSSHDKEKKTETFIKW